METDIVKGTTDQTLSAKKTFKSINQLFVDSFDGFLATVNFEAKVLAIYLVH